MSEKPNDFDWSWTLCFFFGLVICGGALILASFLSDLLMMPFAAAGVLFFSARIVYEAAVFKKMQHPKESESLDVIIRARVAAGFIFLYISSAFLWAMSKCFGDTPLTAMELHTAYYRASYEKEHGEGSVDLILSFYEAYLRPDVEPDEHGIDWMRT